MNRRIAAAVVLAIAATGLLTVYLLPPGRPAPTAPTEAPPTAAIVGPSAAPLAPLAPLGGTVVMVDGKFDDRLSRQVRAPTGSGTQSKLWFAAGNWWGILVEPVSREARIQRLDWTTQLWHDTGTVVDDRPLARADALFDGTHLYVASAGSRANVVDAVRVSRFSYSAAAGRWSLDPDFPVRIGETGVDYVLIDRASDGIVWVSYVVAGRLQVAHTLGDDHRWSEPFTPTSIGITGTAVAVGMAAFGDRIGILWTKESDDSIHFTSRRAGDPDASWDAATTAFSGLRAVDNQLSVKASADGGLYVAVNTSLDTVPNHESGWDQLLLLARKPDGAWISRQFGQIRDNHARPVVLLDNVDHEVLMLAAAPARGRAIYMKHASLDDPQFPDGVGAPVIQTTPDAAITNATSTKQRLDATTGFVVLASDDSTGGYVHAAGSLAGGPPPGRPRDGALPPDGPVAAPPDPVVLVDDTFNPFPVGESLPGTWELSTGSADGKLTVVTRAGTNLAVRLGTRSTGGLRVCRSFAAGTTGVVTIAADVRVDRLAQQDITLLMARGDSRELAGIRIDHLGRIRVAERGGRETTKLILAPGSWYRITLRLDVAARRYGVSVAQAAGGELLLRTGLDWRAADVALVDGLCLEAPAGTAGVGLSFDAVRVIRGP